MAGAILGLLLALGAGYSIDNNTTTAWLWLLVALPAAIGILAVLFGDAFLDYLRSHFDRDP